MKTRFVTILLLHSASLHAGVFAQSPFFNSGAKKVSSPAAKEKGADEKTIRALIADLSDDVFENREKASEKLLRIGGPAIELLRKAAKESVDLEGRERAGVLVVALQELGLHSFRVDYHHSFRKQAVLDKKFELFGPISPDVVKAEPEGLRIKLPAEKGIGPNGVSADFLIKGDCEITVGYELVNPVPSGRAGFEVYIMSDTTSLEAIAFQRTLRNQGNDAYTCTRMTTIDGARRNTYGGGEEPAKGKVGQMRIIRAGSRVALSVKDEIADGFRVVHRVEFGDEPLKLVRFAALPYGTGTPVDVRLIDVRVRGADADAIQPLSEAKTIKNRKKPRD